MKNRKNQIMTLHGLPAIQVPKANLRPEMACDGERPKGLNWISKRTFNRLDAEAHF
jgi:hypothetical protein